jgi:hypothetical protein
MNTMRLASLAAFVACFLMVASAAADPQQVKRIAAALKDGDKKQAQQLAEAAAKKADDLEGLMKLFTRRKDGGLGVGPKEGLVVPDSIDGQLHALARGGANAALIQKAGDALEEMAWRTAAVTEVVLAKAPATDRGKKTKKEWTQMSTQTRDAALELAEAAAKKDGVRMGVAAQKVYAACTACHTAFK